MSDYSLDETETEKTEPNYSFAEHETKRALQRLSAFEAVYKELSENMIAIPAELEKLKAEKKEKTVRYRELFGQKLINSHIAALFERHGIDFKLI
jgi:molecular chaperone GrpE (heat shock protein)